MDILNTLYRVMIECSDPRMKDWFLFSPYLTIFILIVYWYFIFKYGPNLMKNREPYSLKTFIKCYNILQIVLNSFIIYKFFKGGWYTRIWIYCVPISYESTPENMELLEACWWALFTKIMDLIETVIFVLRKKNKQVSFLHVYHHMTTLIIGCIFGKNFCSGMAVFIPLVNCTVHVFMYIYYFLSSCNEHVQSIVNKYKYYITIIQMVQFIILFIHNIQIILPSCNIYRNEILVILTNYVVNFFLFYKFYKNTYTKQKIKQN